MTSDEAKTLVDAWLSRERGEPCAAFGWSARETRTHWRFYWNTVAASEGRADALKGVDAVAVDKRDGRVAFDPKRSAPRAPVNLAFPAPPRGRVETKEEAAAIAQAWIDATQETLASIVSARELPWGWAFSWQSDAFLAGERRLGLVGNGPLVLVGETGKLHALGSGRPIDEAVAAFARDELGLE